jgi:hypothetical protein
MTTGVLLSLQHPELAKNYHITHIGPHSKFKCILIFIIIITDFHFKPKLLVHFQGNSAQRFMISTLLLNKSFKLLRTKKTRTAHGTALVYNSIIWYK